ncbi:MAG: hypothetical protein HYZ43_03590 [Flavobacteriia bacterium]|nr:hypothetical protein [Flavobacteriia bacterium]
MAFALTVVFLHDIPSITHPFVVYFSVATIATIAEAISNNGYDNLSIPASVAGFLIIIQ